MMKKATGKTRGNGKETRACLWAILVISLQVVGLVLFSIVAPVPVEAKTFIVNSTNDEVDTTPDDGACLSASGYCTLRAAIQQANAFAGPDVIKLKTGLYMLTIAGGSEDSCTNGDLDVTDDLTIIGKGAKSTFINGGKLDRVFHIIDPISVTITDVTVQNGYAYAGYPGQCIGGGIYNPFGTLILKGVTISYNFVFDGEDDLPQGGGIYNSGTLTITRSTLSNSTISNNFALALGVYAEGGGIYNSGTLTITRSTISNNVVGANGVAFGGGIYNDGALTIKQSTLSNNSASGGDDSALGGGIYNLSSPLTISGSTLSNNSALGYDARGGGIYNVASPLTITGSKILNNVVRGMESSFGGGIYSFSSGATIRASTISGNAVSGTNWNTGTGGGIYLEDGGTLTVQNASKIVQNFSSIEGGGITYTGSATGSISADSTVAKNIPDDIYDTTP